MSSDFENQVENLSHFTDVAYFSIYSTLALVMIIKVKGRLEMVMWITILFYFLAFLSGIIEVLITTMSNINEGSDRGVIS